MSETVPTNTAAFDRSELMANTSDIVSAYLSRNNMPPAEIPGFISSVMTTLGSGNVGSTGTSAESEAAKMTPAQIKKSVTPDAITSFLDGKPYKSLKRHLATRGHTPDSYRAAFGLPPDYPMVAASYSAARAELAKSMGLGQQQRKAPEPAADVAKKSPPKKKPA